MISKTFVVPRSPTRIAIISIRLTMSRNKWNVSARRVFYAKVQTDVRTGALAVANRVNTPSSVDVSYAHGALTSSYGHGVEVYEGLALFRRPYAANAEEVQRIRDSRLQANNAYYIVDTADDLTLRWPQILAGDLTSLKFIC